MTEYEEKAIGQFKLQLNLIFTVFDIYGLGVFIPQAKEGIVTLALQLHERLGGADVPIITRR